MPRDEMFDPRNRGGELTHRKAHETTFSPRLPETAQFRPEKHYLKRDCLSPRVPFQSKDQSTHEAFVQHCFETEEDSEIVGHVVVMMEPTNWSKFQRWMTDDSTSTKKRPLKEQNSSRKLKAAKVVNREVEHPRDELQLSNLLIGDLATLPNSKAARLASVPKSQHVVGSKTSIDSAMEPIEGARLVEIGHYPLLVPKPDMRVVPVCQRKLKLSKPIPEAQGGNHCAVPTSASNINKKQAFAAPTPIGQAREEVISDSAKLAALSEEESDLVLDRECQEIVDLKSIPDEVVKAAVLKAEAILTSVALPPAKQSEARVALKKPDTFGRSEKPPIVDLCVKGGKEKHSSSAAKPELPFSAQVPTTQGSCPLSPNNSSNDVPTLVSCHDVQASGATQTIIGVPIHVDSTEVRKQEGSWKEQVNLALTNPKKFEARSCTAVGATESPSQLALTTSCRQIQGNALRKSDESPKPGIHLRLSCSDSNKRSNLARARKGASLKHVLLGTSEAEKDGHLEDEIPTNWEPLLPDPILTYEETEIASLMEECKYAQRGKLDWNFIYTYASPNARIKLRSLEFMRPSVKAAFEAKRKAVSRDLQQGRRRRVMAPVIAAFRLTLRQQLPTMTQAPTFDEILAKKSFSGSKISAEMCARPTTLKAPGQGPGPTSRTRKKVSLAHKALLHSFAKATNVQQKRPASVVARPRGSAEFNGWGATSNNAPSQISCSRRNSPSSRPTKGQTFAKKSDTKVSMEAPLGALVTATGGSTIGEEAPNNPLTKQLPKACVPKSTILTVSEEELVWLCVESLLPQLDPRDFDFDFVKQHASPRLRQQLPSRPGRWLPRVVRMHKAEVKSEFRRCCALVLKLLESGYRRPEIAAFVPTRPFAWPEWVRVQLPFPTETPTHAELRFVMEPQKKR